MVAMLEIVSASNNNYFSSFLPTVNSASVPIRDITTSTTTSYRPYNDDHTSVQRHLDRPNQADIEIERSKKDKKWSIGKLFRRKKKEDESSSSQSEDGSKSPSKRKSKKKKRIPAVNNFDHIVIRDTRRAQSVAKPNTRDVTEDGILSDPSAGFINYKVNRPDFNASRDVFKMRENDNFLNKGLLETPSRKKRKSRLKARVEALRNSIKGESSSEDESLKSSSNSSSMIRFRSDDSLMRSRDSSLNKKSRSARNERYIKRLSRDDENQLNKEAELLQQGYTKAEVEMLTRTPTSQSSGYGTCKRDSNKSTTEQPVVNDANRGTMKSESISAFPSTQTYPSTINFNAKVNNERINYSIQYPSNNTNRGYLYLNNNRESSISNQYESPESIMCVKFPLGNVTDLKKEEKAPPVPPPRDMNRKVVTPTSMLYENNPFITERVNNSQNVKYGVPNNDFERIMRRSQERTLGKNGLRRPTSEDHIAIQNNEYLKNYSFRNDQPRRPASVSAEPNHYGLYINSPAWRRSEQSNIVKPEPLQVNQDYLYYADQSPRSRKPISIKSSQNELHNQYLSDSQVSTTMNEKPYHKPRTATEFWKKIDDAERQRRSHTVFANSRSNSDYSSNAQVNRLSTDQNNKLPWNKRSSENIDNSNKNKSFDIMDGAKVWKATTEYKRSTTVEPEKTPNSANKTHVRHKSDTYVSGSYLNPSDDEKNSERRKSTNLDDALNELEAIYNSLGLGDEDLLDRAEQRELMTPKSNEQFNDWNGNDNDIQLRSQPSTPLRRLSRRSTLPDKLQDDMAFRRMNSFSNKDKANFKDSQAQISYMLASPVYVPYASDDDRQSLRNEPDIVYDDVVYRNIKQTNSRLKTIDPQPPFGIPVGPVSPAPQSDYLHATPENKGRSRFVPKRSPDIVADDLAYRSLRKDNRHSSLFNGENYNGYNNNNSYTEFPFNKDNTANIKRKRAVRSLSANIFSMIQKEIDDALSTSKTSMLQKTSSNSDVMKRLRETFEKNDIQKDIYPRNKVLSMLAQEAMDTSNKLGVALAELDRNRNKNDGIDMQNRITDSRTLFLNGLTDKAIHESESSPKKDRLLENKEGAHLSNELSNKQSMGKKTEDSLLLISNQLHKVEDQLKHTIDKDSQVGNDCLRVKENVEKLNEKSVLSETNFSNEISSSSSIPDVVPVRTQPESKSVDLNESTKVIETTKPTINSLNPFLNTDDKMKEINEINAFKELKDGISDLIAGITEVNEKLFVSKKALPNEPISPKAIDSSIAKTTEKLNEVTKINANESPKRASISLSIYDDDMQSTKDGADSTEYNSSEELATIFKLDTGTKPSCDNDKPNKERNDLNSPKIVKNITQHLRRLSVDESTSQNNSLPTVPWRAKRQDNNSQKEKKGEN
ncbi:uncharacterized protein LOC116772747 isoform X3 [Danaus plexippus]|uniref:uncharacterized protein LOC116772747 isoform X3 n=1 Tax=Danaus plexippus TaxID=13037 RepID=UPI002AAFEBEE|nr:uncharacterized protein LOC116772747 isoform X3 [Danaus plexippus]